MFIWQPFPSTRLRVQFCLFSFKSVYFSCVKLSSLTKLLGGGLSFPINLLLCLMSLLLLTRQHSASNFGKKKCVRACVCIMCVRALSSKSHTVWIWQNLLLSMAQKVKTNKQNKKKKSKCFNKKTNKSGLTPAANHDAFHSGGFWASYGFCTFPRDAFKGSEEFRWFTLCLIPADTSVEGLWCQVVIVLW